MILKIAILNTVLLLGLGLTGLHAQDSLISGAKVTRNDGIGGLSKTDISKTNLRKDLRQGFVTSGAGNVMGIYALAYFHEIESFKHTRGDILFGVEYQNQKTDDGQFNGISIVLGYRQFLYKKLCITENFYPNYNHFESSIDGKTYVGFDGFNEISLGWEFEIVINKKVSVALTPQFTYGQALFRTNPWPRHKEKLQTIFFPDIYLGVTF